MKKIALLFVMIAALTLVSCGGNGNKKKAADSAQTEQAGETKSHGDCANCPNKSEGCGSDESAEGCTDKAEGESCCDDKAESAEGSEKAETKTESCCGGH